MQLSPESFADYEAIARDPRMAPLLLEACPGADGLVCGVLLGTNKSCRTCHGTGQTVKPFDVLAVLAALAAVGIRLSLGWGIDKAGKWMPSWGMPDRFVMATGISAAANAAALLSAARQAMAKVAARMAKVAARMAKEG